jgi:hypothetical protein
MIVAARAAWPSDARPIRAAAKRNGNWLEACKLRSSPLGKTAAIKPKWFNFGQPWLVGAAAAHEKRGRRMAAPFPHFAAVPLSFAGYW